MIRKFIIRIFKLTDISDLLLKTKKNQKKMDDIYWSAKLQDREEKLTRFFELERQELTAQIDMLNQQISDYRKREKDLCQREFLIKKQGKFNLYMASRLDSKVEDFGKAILSIVGEIKGIKDEVSTNRIRVDRLK